MVTVSIPELASKVEKIFFSFGHSLEDARWAAEALIAADIWGIPSHGVGRLPHYIKKYASGAINPKAIPKVIAETPSTATLDGQEGQGLVIAQQAMRLAISKAKTCGTGWVAVRNSSHFGCGSFHTQLALPENMIGIAFSNGSPVVAPKGSTERLFGTNPIAVAFPTPGDLPFSFDFSTSMATCGFIAAHAKRKVNLPLGVVIDSAGEVTTNINVLDHNGAILPMGYNATFDNSHKGYALGAMVDLFCGVLSGANFGKWVPNFTISQDDSNETVGQGIGHFIGAIQIEAFRPREEYCEAITTWLNMVKKATPTASSTVFLPGEKEADHKTYHEAHGLHIPQEIFDLIESYQ